MRYRRLVTVASLTAALALPVSVGAVAAPATTSASEPAAAPDELLVGYEIGTSRAERAEARRQNDARLMEVVVQGDAATRTVERVALPSGSDRNAAARRFEANRNVVYAEPNWVVHPVTTSNDPLYTDGSLWGMYGDATSPANQYGSQAGEAWATGNTGKGDGSIWVGVIDTGAQFSHEDLVANFGPNPGDPADGLDNDGNGYVDDTYGWDFYHDDNSVYDSRKHDEHGTHVSGTIGAKGNNGIGVAGVNWDVKMLNGKFLGPFGGYTSDAVNAVDYFTDLKVKRGLNVVATSNSWGGGGYSQTLVDAIARGAAADILFVAAAGNDGDDTDEKPHYPSSYDTVRDAGASYDAVISVAALRKDGTKPDWSNYGKVSVDLGAPGADVYSTVPNNGYASFSGTSMATPHVTGAVALYRAANPTAGAAATKDAILTSTLATTALAKTVTGGRLDVSGFLATTGASPIVSWQAPTGGATVSGTSVAMEIAASDEEDGTSLTVEWRVGSGTWRSTTFDATSGTFRSSWDSTAVTDGSYDLEARATDSDTNPTTAAITVTVDNVDDPPSVSWVTPTAGATVKDSVPLEVAASDDRTPTSSLTVSWEVFDSSNVKVAGGAATHDSASGTFRASWDSTAVADGDYTLKATVTDGASKSSTASIGVKVANTTSTVSVVTPSGTDGYATTGGKNNHLHLLVTVTLKDGAGAPVSNASVTIRLEHNGSLYGTFSGTTGTDGTVTFKATNAPSGTYVTTVTDVAAGGLTWNGTTPTNAYCKTTC